jgi:hypothetical protein
MNLVNLIPELLGDFLRAPEIHLDDHKVSVFEKIYSRASNEGDLIIKYDCEFPKYEFLSYLIENRNVLLHGSNEKKIRFLVPLRRSTDLRGVGNLNAVYACSDGIWPIFFAVWNRDYYGSTTNSCFRASDTDGRLRKFYSFLIAPDSKCFERDRVADKKCWTDGMIYILPRAPFTQLVDDAGNPLEEWISADPVPVLAKLPVTPQDFLFLNDVRIRDDAPPVTQVSQLKIDPNVYDSYMGKYEILPDLILNLEKREGCLIAQVPGFPTVKMRPESETVYRLEGIDGQAVFACDGTGKVAQLMFFVGGKGLPVRKIE